MQRLRATWFYTLGHHLSTIAVSYSPLPNLTQHTLLLTTRLFLTVVFSRDTNCSRLPFLLLCLSFSSSSCPLSRWLSQLLPASSHPCAWMHQRGTMLRKRRPSRFHRICTFVFIEFLPHSNKHVQAGKGECKQ